jgi:hypothetical protein
MDLLSVLPMSFRIIVVDSVSQGVAVAALQEPIVDLGELY